MPAETHMERQSLDRDAVLQLVREQLADILEGENGLLFLLGLMFLLLWIGR